MKNCLYADQLECGLDESGCGPMMGDLYCAGVILPTECPYEECQEYWDMLNDSKKVSKKNRDKLFDFIKEIAIDYGIERISVEEIDKNNIFQSRSDGFHKVLNNLNIKPTQIIVDGTAFRPYYNEEGEIIPHICIKGGDEKFRNIAAASILAKVSRDRYVEKLHEEYPEYNWVKNKGYGTKEHLEAIKQNGITKYHRKTFGICKQWRDLPDKNLKSG